MSKQSDTTVVMSGDNRALNEEFERSIRVLEKLEQKLLEQQRKGFNTRVIETRLKGVRGEIENLREKLAGGGGDSLVAATEEVEELFSVGLVGAFVAAGTGIVAFNDYLNDTVFGFDSIDERAKQFLSTAKTLSKLDTSVAGVVFPDKAFLEEAIKAQRERVGAPDLLAPVEGFGRKAVNTVLDIASTFGGLGATAYSRASRHLPDYERREKLAFEESMLEALKSQLQAFEDQERVRKRLLELGGFDLANLIEVSPSKRKGKGIPGRPGPRFGGLGSDRDILGIDQRDLEIDPHILQPLEDAATENIRRIRAEMSEASEKMKQDMKDMAGVGRETWQALAEFTRLSFEDGQAYADVAFQSYKAYMAAQAAIDAFKAGSGEAAKGRWWAVGAAVAQVMLLVAKIKAVNPGGSSGGGGSRIAIRNANAPGALGNFASRFAPAQSVAPVGLQAPINVQLHGQLSGRNINLASSREAAAQATIGRGVRT